MMLWMMAMRLESGHVGPLIIKIRSSSELTSEDTPPHGLDQRCEDDACQAILRSGHGFRAKERDGIGLQEPASFRSLHGCYLKWLGR